jgi:hypothetical protein
MVRPQRVTDRSGKWIDRWLAEDLYGQEGSAIMRNFILKMPLLVACRRSTCAPGRIGPRFGAT